MSSKMPNDPESMADHFNANVDYTRSKDKATAGVGRAHPSQSVNLAQTQADAQARGPTMTTSTDTSGAGVFGADDLDEASGEPRISIDSTNAGVDHRRTSYSYTAATLGHPHE
ncbi:hypothetical protein BDV06DRAFT_187257 [Aspergillus oleicola]